MATTQTTGNVVGSEVRQAFKQANLLPGQVLFSDFDGTATLLNSIAGIRPSVLRIARYIMVDMDTLQPSPIACLRTA